MFNNKKHQSFNHDGFTLIEVVFALAIFSIIMLGLIKGELSAVSAQSGNLFRDEAVRLAEDRLSELQSEQFSITGTAADLVAAPWSAPQNMSVKMRGSSVVFARSAQVTDLATSSTAMKRIEVVVGWSQGTDPTQLAPTLKNHQVSLSTIIVRND